MYPFVHNMVLDHLFDDKRVLSLLIFGWTTVVSIIFICIMVDDRSPFLAFGPNDRTVLFGFKLNTWTKWSCVAMYTFMSTCIADFTSDSVGPWITNTIQDHKNQYLPYSKVTCLCIVQAFSMYAIIMGTIHLFVALSQIDFMMIRMAADLLVNYYTTSRFIEFKQVNAKLYKQYVSRDEHICEDDAVIVNSVTCNVEPHISEVGTKVVCNEEGFGMQSFHPPTSDAFDVHSPHK
jgi:hypothetical protein